MWARQCNFRLQRERTALKWFFISWHYFSRWLSGAVEIISTATSWPITAKTKFHCWKLHLILLSSNQVRKVFLSTSKFKLNDETFAEEVFLFPRRVAEKFKCSFRINFFGRMSYGINRAKDVEKILGSTKHIDKSVIYNLLHPFLRTGLLTSNGDKWHTRRRLLTPTFHFNIVKEFFEVFREETDRLVESLKPETGKALDIIPVSSQFTLNTICGEFY